jgi:serine/threonine-protein kinase
MDHHSITPPPFRGGELPDPLESDVTVIGSPSTITPHDYPSGLTSRELAHALRGEMLGHFLLQEFIGGGGMGVVFKALDTTLDRIVAVKVVASHRVDSEDLQRRFLVEAQSTARLDHPNIARVHYIGRDRGLPYIVFEYIDGMNLRDLAAERGPLPVGDAISYVYQIAHALAHAWQREVVHRDIKPSNILVTADGQAKLVDMGLARLRQMDAQDDELTATGITLGTFDYISPEQARDPRLADARSDIYSLGCTLFFMLAGQAPFAQGTALQKLLQHQSERPADLRTFRSDIPDSVARLSRRMLAKSPGDRQQTPVELVAELAEILEELGVPLPYATGPLPWSVPPRSTPRWRRHVLWAAPVTAMLFMGLAIDRFSREGATAAPFPALKTATARTSTSETATELESIEAETGLSPGATTPLESTPPPGLGEPLPLGENWDLSRSLWESLTDWPAAPSPGEGTTQRSRAIVGPHLDAADEWPAPVLFPPPAADIDFSSALPRDESGPPESTP